MPYGNRQASDPEHLQAGRLQQRKACLDGLSAGERYQRPLFPGARPGQLVSLHVLTRLPVKCRVPSQRDAEALTREIPERRAPDVSRDDDWEPLPAVGPRSHEEPEHGRQTGHGCHDAHLERRGIEDRYRCEWECKKQELAGEKRGCLAKFKCPTYGSANGTTQDLGGIDLA